MHILGQNLRQKISPYLDTAQFSCSALTPSCAIVCAPYKSDKGY